MELSDVGGGVQDVTADPSSPYYIGPIGHDHTSGDEIREEVTQQVDEEIAKGWLGDVVTPLLRDETIQRRYEQRIVAVRDSVDDGVEIRDHGAAPSSLWDNATHQQMLDAITTNADSAAVAVTSEEWVRLGKELTEHQKNLADAINDSLADWQGEGGDAARKHLADVGLWLGNTAKGATLTGRQQEIHSQALNETQKQMAANPPVNFDVQAANAHLQTITDPVVYAQQAQLDQQALQQQEAARQQAARIMTQYDDTVAGATITPAFVAPPKLGGPNAQIASLRTGATGPASARIPATEAGAAQAANLRSATTAGVPAAAGAGAGDVNAAVAAANLNPSSPPAGSPMPGLDTSGAGTGVDAPTLNTYSGSSGYGAGTGAVPQLSTPDYPAGTTGTYSGGTLENHASVPDLDIPDSTVASSAVDTGTSGSSSARMPTIGYSGGINGDSIASRLGGPTVSGNPLAGLDSVSSVSGPAGTPLGGGTSTSTGAKGLGGAGGAGAAALKGFGGGGSGLGGVGGASGASGARLGAGGVAGASGAAAAAEEAAAARGAAGATGAAGRAGTPAAGGMAPHGGKGQGAEDKEHRVADYLEGDPDLFEGGDVVAPPVIGDWKKNKKEEKK
ncbi:hypothetical protein [Amycolatopsis methanolica]|uniref:PPE family domain-containing protein n=1 Tax=Amycolatopsis methanolica 239 TaxID=1068978 RepID=A0A076MNE8_AMYME|nr:hypothetical protein [Amycolatopsis methanolica]AIJ22383.1 hypothetical protein AMETH_2291 [Amycolatopsis methanolica 239]